MKVLVLGSNSFIAKEIKDYFYNKNFFYFNRSSLDLTNTKQVEYFFANDYYDFVINTCVVGGVRNKQDDFSVLSNNLLMFDNLLKVKNKYKYLFNFCSGAAFDRKRHINNAPEEHIFLCRPDDYYGLSKNIVSRHIWNLENIFNFRIFGCFGKHELETRFLKNSLNNINNNTDIIVNKDKYMDYISAIDVCKILEYYMNNIKDIKYKDINLVYDDKIKLSDFGNQILELKKSKMSVKILNDGLDNSYTGSSNKLLQLPIKLNYFTKSLEDIIKCQS